MAWSTRIALVVVLPALAALFSGLVGRVRGVPVFLVFATVSTVGLCGVSALAFTACSRRPLLVKLPWAAVTAGFVGVAWAVRAGFAGVDVELFAPGPWGLHAISADMRAFFTGFGVAVVAFWVFVAALAWAYRRERRLRVELRRRARAEWHRSSR